MTFFFVFFVLLLHIKLLTVKPLYILLTAAALDDLLFSLHKQFHSGHKNRGKPLTVHLLAVLKLWHGLVTQDVSNRKEKKKRRGNKKGGEGKKRARDKKISAYFTNASFSIDQSHMQTSVREVQQQQQQHDGHQCWGTAGNRRKGQQEMRMTNHLGPEGTLAKYFIHDPSRWQTSWGIHTFITTYLYRQIPEAWWIGEIWDLSPFQHSTSMIRLAAKVSERE